MSQARTLMLVFAALGAIALAQENVMPRVSAAADVSIRTFIVQDKISRPIATDQATLAVGRRGGVRKQLELAPGKKSKAESGASVEVAVLVTPLSASAVAVELVIETIAKPRAGGEATRSRIVVTLEAGASKLVNVYEDPELGANVMAMVEAKRAEPVVHVEVPKAAASTVLRSVQFQVVVKRLAEGEEVYSETATLNTWLGKQTGYETGMDVPTEVVASEDGPGSVTYASERAEIRIVPKAVKGPDLEIEVELRANLHQGADLASAYPVDGTVTLRVKRAQSFRVYAIFGQKEILAIEPALQAVASGYVFEVVPSF